MHSDAQGASRVSPQTSDHPADDFVWGQLREYAESEGLSMDEVIRHALAYYLAALDEGRLAARPIPREKLG